MAIRLPLFFLFHAGQDNAAPSKILHFFACSELCLLAAEVGHPHGFEIRTQSELDLQEPQEDCHCLHLSDASDLSKLKT
ncbi:MAG: hypothetical protein ACXWRZ_18655, partial [Bdellovibrio sp.]